MDQKRFVLALLFSAAILFLWSYLFPVKNPQQNNANNSTAQQQQASPTPTPSAQAIPPSTQTQATTAVQSSPDTTPQRSIIISTPLYEAKLDSQGAVTKSWIIKKNKASNRILYSAGSGKNNPQPLQLISPEGLKRNEAPLRLSTDDANVDAALASKNYKVNGVDGESGDVSINLADKDSKRIEFTLHDDATGLDVTKSITFYADRYSVDMEVKLTRNGQAVPQTRLLIGPSIGDQGVPHYTFYSVAPEGVAATSEGSVERFVAAAVHKNEGGWFSSKRPEGTDKQIVHEAVNWAGVDDTYFGMVAVSPKTTQGLEYRTSAYEHDAGGKKEERYLITAFVPIPTDGSRMQLYVGPKDHQLLTAASADVRAAGGPTVDLEGLINYGFFSSVRRYLAVPILIAINALQRLTGSYGVAIILFTVFIYSLFFPLKWQSSRKMKKAQKYAPRMKEVQEKIKGLQQKGVKQDDPRLKDLQMEQLRLMKEANPLGGCLPLLIQMPFLFALYSAITISLDFRQAAFLWMPDLSSGDPIHLLEIMMAGSMIVLQLITPAPSADPLQRKMMAIGMPLFMLYILWGAPAGLLVYWLIGNIVGFSQQFLINHLTKSEDDEEPPKEKKKAEKQAAKKLNATRVSEA
ncbi:MAG: membrane protein insertase YidC [Pyrinomonadaceae bacterium]